jgi:hypothetical protein
MKKKIFIQGFPNYTYKKCVFLCMQLCLSGNPGRRQLDICEHPIRRGPALAEQVDWKTRCWCHDACTSAFTHSARVSNKSLPIQTEYAKILKQVISSDVFQCLKNSWTRWKRHFLVSEHNAFTTEVPTEQLCMPKAYSHSTYYVNSIYTHLSLMFENCRDVSSKKS